MGIDEHYCARTRGKVVCENLQAGGLFIFARSRRLKSD